MPASRRGPSTSTSAAAGPTGPGFAQGRLSRLPQRLPAQGAGDFVVPRRLEVLPGRQLFADAAAPRPQGHFRHPVVCFHDFRFAFGCVVRPVVQRGLKVAFTGRNGHGAAGNTEAARHVRRLRVVADRVEGRAVPKHCQKGGGQARTKKAPQASSRRTTTQQRDTCRKNTTGAFTHGSVDWRCACESQSLRTLWRRCSEIVTAHTNIPHNRQRSNGGRNGSASIRDKRQTQGQDNTRDTKAQKDLGHPRQKLSGAPTAAADLVARCVARTVALSTPDRDIMDR